MAKKLNVQLVIIDPQNDFMGNDDGTPYSLTTSGKQTLTAQLPVQGATSDMGRLAKLIDRVGKKLTDINVTLDSHRKIGIERATFWMDQRGNPPNPFTIISASDIEAGIWTPRNPGFRARALKYARALKATPGAYDICVWTSHCNIGSWGHNVYHELNAALDRWSEKEYANVNFVTKGSNPFTEHYGALMAEVPDPDDPSTGLNTGFLQTVSEADIVGVAGEASSHCVLKTVQQIADNIGVDQLKKFYILEDCMSPVGAVPGGPNFPQIAQDFLREMRSKGMTITGSVDFLA